MITITSAAAAASAATTAASTATTTYIMFHKCNTHTTCNGICIATIVGNNCNR